MRVLKEKGGKGGGRHVGKGINLGTNMETSVGHWAPPLALLKVEPEKFAYFPPVLHMPVEW